MKFDFTDKHIVVTGGTGALGLAVVTMLLEAGARCSIPSHRTSISDDFDFTDHPDVFLKPGVDLREEQATHEFYSEAVQRLGGLWASVNIAGGFAMAKIEDTGHTDFMEQLNLNLLTCFHSCRTAIRHIRKTSRGGRIVNIAARPGIDPSQGAGMSAYTVSKAGVVALTKSLAAEVGAENIMINAVAPSAIDTPANRKAMPKADFSKWLKPEEIAAQILYLIAEENTVTNGAVIPAFGKG